MSNGLIITIMVYIRNWADRRVRALYSKFDKATNCFMIYIKKSLKIPKGQS